MPSHPRAFHIVLPCRLQGYARRFTMAHMRKLSFVIGCALISAPAVIARAQAQFTWIGWHALPRTQGGGWCYISGPHQHPYRALADMPVTLQGGGYVCTGEVAPPAWNGWHGGPCRRSGYVKGCDRQPDRPSA